MKSMKVFVTHGLFGDYVARLGEHFEVVVWPKRDISKTDLIHEVAGVDGILPLLTEKIDREVMEAAGENLKVIANYAVGYDNIDVVEATKRGIVVTNTPGILTEAVGEHAIALMLSLTRRIVEGDRFVRAGKYKGWEPDLLVGSGVRGKVLGIIGLGRIGRWTGRIACALGMKVVYNSRTRDEEFEEEHNATYHTIEKLLEMADVVSLNVPLTEQTKGMIGERELAAMKKSALLINTARGAVVNEKALIEALRRGEIAGAGLDVFDDESHPNEDLYKLPNVVLTPHIASATIEARMMMTKIATESLEAVLKGRMPDQIVNKEVWEKRRK